MVQILNVLVVFAVFANAFAIPILETRDIATEYTGSDTSSLTLKVSHGHGRLEARGKNARNTKKKPQTTIGKVVNGVQKYAKQCHFIRDEETGDVLIRELDEDDEDGAIMYARDPAGTFGKIFKAAKGLAHRCQFIRSDETDGIYVREISEVEVGSLDARGNGRKGKTGALGKVITGAKALAQRCHFMRDLEGEEMDLLARRSPGSTLGSVLKKVKGIAHRCHFIRDGEEDLLGLD
ncbi:hypothetical protein D9613_007172 [Agrocybe pediades]|uniref:Uncharacterized protein n=1 Tax=Agrocybe pediades TaxID=84607 RepID=A0A8H4VHY7_9AGAR|nr:hypothetical protein D9613_007172 [Agrocybe pediades]